jgi:hypothetical protein
MKTEFAILNPTNGSYTRVTTREAVTTVAAQVAADFYFMHSQQSPLTIIITDDNGIESWTAPDGTKVLSPAEVAIEVEKHARFTIPISSIPVIPSVTL